MATTRDLISQLQRAQPVEPRGWFRWLHDHLAGRYAHNDADLEKNLAEQGWGEISRRFPELSSKERSELLPIIGRHAWSVGRLELIDLAESFWAHLGPSERGAILTGLSEANPCAELLGWLRYRLPECAFSPESACQLACNATWHQWSDVLSAVLNSGTDLSATIHRGDVWDYPKTRWPEILCKLSHRVIDMVLEAALVRNNLEATQHALRAGADPNIPVWRLERSFNEEHCALSFAISQNCRRAAEMLLEAGASPEGTDFTACNYPLYLAIHNGWDDFAGAFLKQGASLRLSDASSQHSVLPRTEGSESAIRMGPRMFFGHFDEELNWAQKAIGSLIKLAPIVEKQAFYTGNGQGGTWNTILDVVVGNVDRLKLYEALGLDTRLTAEELCTAIDSDAFDGLCYLLSKHGVAKRDRALFRVRHRKPDFGAVCRELELQTQSDGINNADEFNPAEQPALVLPDGTKLYVDLDAIAPPNHCHGPCLDGHFWLRVDKANYRRRKDRVIVTRFRSRWAMTKLPTNRYQLDDLLPCIKEVNGSRFFLGKAIGELSFETRDPEIQSCIRQWLESVEFQAVVDDAERRIRAQDQANFRPKAPVLSEDELQGYPPIFWPHLVRLQTGFIGITTESCSDDPGVFDLYKVWARRNKVEDAFVPDPRLLTWAGWNEVPTEFRPFFEIDSFLGTPRVRFKANNDYERAMIHKAVMWKNAWMTPRILEAIEEAKKVKRCEGDPPRRDQSEP